MAEVIQGVFPGGDGPDGALPSLCDVAALNLSPKPGDPEGNRSLAEKEIAAVLALEPSLRYVVLPELFTCAYSALESVYQYAEDAECGESAKFFTGLARELGIYIAYGFPKALPALPRASSTARTSWAPRAWSPPTASATWSGAPPSASSSHQGRSRTWSRPADCASRSPSAGTWVSPRWPGMPRSAVPT